MTENRIGSTDVSVITTTGTDFEVNAGSTDGVFEQKESRWNNDKYDIYLGYYQDEKVPEITAIIDAKANYVMGKGFKADEMTTLILDSIKGNGKQTFNEIIKNGERVMDIGGNFYGHIIRDDDENLINLKVLDPAVMTNVFGRDGLIKGFEQRSKTKGNKPKKYKPEEIFYLARNIIGDEMHGRGIIQKLKLIMDKKNQAMEDQGNAMHWNVIPRWKFKLKTDDPAEIAAYKTKMDTSTGTGANIYEPFDISESELITVPPNSTLNPMVWIEYLDDKLYEYGGIPKIIVGGTGGFTEQATTITYLSFQQTIEARQLYLEEQILSQLNLVIELEFPATVENNLLSDKEKDGPINIDPSETTAGQSQ